MKANSTDFSTIAHGLRVTRADGDVYGFTSARTSTTIGGVLYEASQGLDVSSIVTSAGLNVDNLELGTLDDGSLFDRADIYGGVWDNAAFLIFRYDWTAPTDPVENLIAGTIGNITILSGKIKAELRGLQQYLQQPAGNATSATCRARFADFPAINGKNRCGLDSVDWTNSLTVTAVTSRNSFTTGGSLADDYHGEGVVTWLTGNNAGLVAKVRAQTAARVFTLVNDMQHDIQIGDTLEAVAGCRKRLAEDCFAKFDNVLNFQGEPHLPMIDQITASPDSA